jgi:hypothetical protein
MADNRCASVEEIYLIARSRLLADTIARPIERCNRQLAMKS